MSNNVPSGKYYGILTGTGLAIRDADHRCIGIMTVRGWVEDRRACVESIIRQLNDGRIRQDAIEASGFDLSPCRICGKPVVCIPDGLPCCKYCHAQVENTN